MFQGQVSRQERGELGMNKNGWDTRDWDSVTTTEVSFKSLSHAMKPHNIQSQLTGVIYRSEGVKGGIIGPGSLSCLVLVFIRRKPGLRADTGGSDEYKYCEMLSGLSWLAGWCTGASCQPATCPPRHRPDIQRKQWFVILQPDMQFILLSGMRESPSESGVNGGANVVL